MNSYSAIINGISISLEVNEDQSIMLNNQSKLVNFNNNTNRLVSVSFENKTKDVVIVQENGNNFVFLIEGKYFFVEVKSSLEKFTESILSKSTSHSTKTKIKAPMPGLIIQFYKNIGEDVKEGEQLVVLEAMKMQNVLKSPRNGKVKEIIRKTNESVEKGEVILIIE